MKKAVIRMPFCNFVQTYEMQRLILILLSSFFLMISCKRSEPKGILSEKVMADLMTDVHLLDGYLNTLPVDSTRRVIGSLYGTLFDKYGIDSVRFKENVDYYLGNPMVSKELYVDVTKKINGYEDEYRRADSIRNAQVTDSLRVVRWYERLKEDAHRLILVVELDTVPLTYQVHQHDFMNGAGLYAIRPYQPDIPLPAPPTPITEGTVTEIPKRIEEEPLDN